VYANKGIVSFVQCNLWANNASISGGALTLNAISTATLSNVTFEDNVASSGGALYISGNQSDINVQQVICRNNNAAVNGGAVYVDSGTVALKNSSFVGNAGQHNGGKFCGRSNPILLSTSYVIL
jgi:predicted outer membrane repeat protein